MPRWLMRERRGWTGVLSSWRDFGVSWLAQRIVHNDRLATRDGSYGMRRIGWNYSGKARTCALGDSANRDLQLAFDHFPHFFLRMEVLMDRRARGELVMRE